MPATELPARNGRPREFPPFLVALLVGIGAHVSALLLLRWPVELNASHPTPAPFVHYSQPTNAGQAEVMRQEELLSDPQVLYTLTPRNYAQRAATATPTRTQPTLPPFVLQPTADDVGKKMDGLSSKAVQTATPAEALKPEQWDPLHTMGQSSNSRSPLSARGARLRIVRQQVATANAGPDLEITWPPDMAPDAGNAFWQPVNFLLLFNASGLVGEPQLENSFSVAKVDDNPKVDDDLRKKLSSYFRLHPLKPGYYTVEIGP